MSSLAPGRMGVRAAPPRRTLLGAMVLLAGCGGSLGAVGGLGGGQPDAGSAAGTGGSGGSGGIAGDRRAALAISDYLNTLPSGGPAGTQRAPVVDAILRACEEFGPPAVTGTGWQTEYCWAHLAAAIERDSGYDATATVADAYSMRPVMVNGAQVQADDPTVGLLQIRFSSTVRDFAASGPLDRLAAVGCMFPFDGQTATESGDSDFWAVTGPQQNMDVMTNLACNIGLGAWSFYAYATANGDATQVTSMAQYCAGGGTAANLVTGLLSHFEGPGPAKGVIADLAGVNALQASNPGAYDYVTKIKTWFDAMLGPLGGTHPFFLTLLPNPAQYCAF